MTVMRPLCELDLTHEFRFHPHDVAFADLGHPRDLLERRIIGAQWFKLREQLVDVALLEAGTAIADPGQLLPAIGAEHKGSETPGASSLALRPAADHELLTAVRLHLEPVPCA